MEKVFECSREWVKNHPRLSLECFTNLRHGSKFFVVVYSDGSEKVIPYQVNSVRVRGWRVGADRLVPCEPWMKSEYAKPSRFFCFGDDMYSYECVAEKKATPQAGTKEATVPVDTVANPAHYNSHPSGVECIQVVEHMTFNLGCVIKYLWRAGLKDGEPATKDLKKAQWYIAREIARLEKDKKNG